MWCMSVGYKWKRPERRFKIATLHEERTHPTHAHGLTRALEREFLGEPWWQVEYPDGSNGEWFTRPEQRQATPQEKAWNIPFDFPHLDQEGDFKIHFRGIVRAGDAPVPLDTWHWRRSASEGWTPLR